jgi:hypothetical protein
MHRKILSASNRRSSDSSGNLPGNSDLWVPGMTADRRNLSLSVTQGDEGEYREGGVSGEMEKVSGQEIGVSGQDIGTSREEFGLSGEDRFSAPVVVLSDHPPA